MLRCMLEVQSQTAPPEHPKKPFSQHDLESLRLGNRTARSACTIVKACHTEGIPWGVENPASSRMWSLPLFKHLFKDPKVQMAVIDQFSSATMMQRTWRYLGQLAAQAVDGATSQGENMYILWEQSANTRSIFPPGSATPWHPSCAAHP